MGSHCAAPFHLFRLERVKSGGGAVDAAGSKSSSFSTTLKVKCAQCCGCQWAPAVTMIPSRRHVNVSLGGNSSPMSLPTVPELGRECDFEHPVHTVVTSTVPLNRALAMQTRSEKVHSSESSDYPYTQLFSRRQSLGLSSSGRGESWRGAEVLSKSLSHLGSWAPFPKVKTSVVWEMLFRCYLDNF